MAIVSMNGLSRGEANSVVAVGCLLMADGLAGAVGEGMTDDGAVFVEIMHPRNGRPMFIIGKERGRFVVRNRRGERLAGGRSLAALLRDPFADVGRPPAGHPTA